MFDKTGDGVISASDAAFSALSIWIDANHNGRSEAQELATLESHGIESIDLRYDVFFTELQ